MLEAQDSIALPRPGQAGHAVGVQGEVPGAHKARARGQIRSRAECRLDSHTRGWLRLGRCTGAVALGVQVRCNRIQILSLIHGTRDIESIERKPWDLDRYLNAQQCRAFSLSSQLVAVLQNTRIFFAAPATCRPSASPSSTTSSNPASRWTAARPIRASVGCGSNQTAKAGISQWSVEPLNRLDRMPHGHLLMCPNRFLLCQRKPPFRLANALNVNLLTRAR